ncbi:MAG TPA: hypothetical protein VFL36_14880 [Myxococcales bacterium]|nr:hypothetical protein [Myxococcales bacterium]
MSAMKLALLAAAVPLLAAGAAGAKVYIEWRPRVSLMGGFDDNVQLNGSGGDGFGQAVPGLKLDIFGDHDLHMDVDCQAGVARLAHPEEFGISSGAFATNETCGLGTRVKLSTRDKLQLRTSATYAQDPFAIAGLGLLLRPGQTQIFVAKLQGMVEHALTGHSHFDYGFDAQALAFGANDPGNGYVLAPQARYAWKTSARSTWDLGVREQLFFAVGANPNAALGTKATPGGLLDEAHSALLGYTYALAPWANLTVRGGGILVTGAAGEVVMPTARLGIESYTPDNLFSFTVAHDLMIGPTTAGPVVADVVELGWIRDWEHFALHLGTGIYRNIGVDNAYLALGALGYSAEGSVAWKFTRDLRLECAALRDARLNDLALAQQVDRDVLQLRFVWEKARF